MERSFLTFLGRAYFCLVLVCCISCQEGKYPSTDVLEIKIELATTEFAPWSMNEVQFSVCNRSNSPVLLLEVQLATDRGETLLAPACVFTQQANISPDRFLLHGTYYYEDIGPIARMPLPPEWRWEGTDTIAMLQILPVGESRSWKKQFRARYESGKAFQATVKYLLWNEKIPLHQATAPKITPLDKADNGMPFGNRGMVASHKIEVEYRPMRQAPTETKQEVDFSGLLSSPAVYTYAVSHKVYQEFKGETVVSHKPFQIRRFAFDIAEARKRCGVPEGPYTYALSAQIWVIGDTHKTHLVSPGQTITVDGDARPLANALNESPSHNITLFSWAEEKDPHGYLAAFKKAGFATEIRMQKGGSYEGLVTVEAGKLGSFLQILERLGLRMEGDGRVEPK